MSLRVARQGETTTLRVLVLTFPPASITVSFAVNVVSVVAEYVWVAGLDAAVVVSPKSQTRDANALPASKVLESVNVRRQQNEAGTCTQDGHLKCGRQSRRLIGGGAFLKVTHSTYHKLCTDE